jgi:general nucleoside transport system permease protein
VSTTPSPAKRTVRDLTPDLIVQPRARPPAWVTFALPVGSILAAAGVASVILLAAGYHPFNAYRVMLQSAFGSRFAIGESLVEAAPLILTGLAVAVAFRLQVFNIGAEGQLYLGAICSAGIALLWGNALPSGVVIPLALIAGIAGGMVFALLAGLPRAYFGTSEIVVTLMLNFVALNILNYLIFGSASPWRDPHVILFPQGRAIPQAARLPFVSGQVNAGILLAVGAALAIWAFERVSRWGFEVRVAGDSAGAARYMGVHLRRKILSIFALSGGLAGLAGAVIVTGRLGALEPRAIVHNYGYLGILVAALARLNLVAVVPMGIFVAALNTAGPSMQSAGIPSPVVFMLQGAVLMFAVIGEFWVRYRVSVVRRHQAKTEPVETEAVERGPAR